MQRGWVGDVAGLFFFSRQNYFQYALMRWVQTTLSFLFRQSLSSLSGAPQWLILPVARGEAQCAEVNFGIFCEECLHLVQHVISRRYDIEEVFDDAEIKIGAHGVGR